uniref:Thioredoxin domain-containing protein n=1 Tax=Oxyrrhis marina TaxID=2969 RepID=A0A7S4GLY1_OXYMA
MASALVDLLGPKLAGRDGEVDTSSLDGKTIGLYFSAHWCPPCRGFTPKLAEWYQKDLQSKGLEVVFVSSDRDEDAFKEYFAEMPWLALPYADRSRKEQLSKKFKVQGIPSFVLLKSSGEVITLDGRSAVSEDPTGANFPWLPEPFSLGDSFVGKDGDVPAASIAGKVKLLYFSAHWCPPCRGFTPQLAKAYATWKEKGMNVEVIFVSGDKDQSSFDEYYGEMPWIAVPFEDKRCKQWNKQFEVSGIPTVVILDTDNSVINKDGRGTIAGDFEGKTFPWHPPLIGDLENPSGIQDAPAIVALMETQTEQEQEQALSELRVLAEKYRCEEKKTGETKYVFFAAKTSGSTSGRVRQMTKQQSLPPAKHEHSLAVADGNTGWGCDGCSKSGDECKGRNRCTEGCDFDLCDDCLAESGKAIPSLPVKVVLLDLASQWFYEMSGDLTTKGVVDFLGEFEGGKLVKQEF